MGDTTHQQEPARALTVGTIALRLGQPLHKIEYIIASRNLQPTVWAGHARVFSESDLQFIAGVLRRIAADRDGGRL